MTVRIKLLVETGMSGGNHEDEMEIPRAKWEAMDPSEQEAYLDEQAREYRGNCVSCSAWVVEDDDVDP